MAAELLLGPVLALLLFGGGVFFVSLAVYLQQQREFRFEDMRARWQGRFTTPSGHMLSIAWHKAQGWIISLQDALPGSQTTHFRAELRGDTLTAVLGASGVALDFRFLDEDTLVSPLVPGLHGDVSVEPDWLRELLSAKAPRWRRG